MTFEEKCRHYGYIKHLRSFPYSKIETGSIYKIDKINGGDMVDFIVGHNTERHLDSQEKEVFIFVTEKYAEKHGISK